LSDWSDASLDDAVARLDGWRLERVDSKAIAEGVRSGESVRAILVSTTDPVVLRSAIEAAHEAGTPAVGAGADRTARRRAVELAAEEWFRCPADAEEIAQRIRSAVARGHPRPQSSSDHVERAVYEQMLHDSFTGLPTLPVTIERSRALFKERGELV